MFAIAENKMNTSKCVANKLWTITAATVAHSIRKVAPFIPFTQSIIDETGPEPSAHAGYEDKEDLTKRHETLDGDAASPSFMFL